MHGGQCCIVRSVRTRDKKLAQVIGNPGHGATLAPMKGTPARILAHLQSVEEQRALRERDPALAQRVQAVKAYQQRRFAETYRDVLSDGRYGPAARFFLEELYGPGDFSTRDRQFARIVPSLGRWVPGDLLEVVEALGELHALSEGLDTRMAQAVRTTLAMDSQAYVAAWRSTGGRTERERQLALTLEIGRALDRHTRSALLRQSLRLMRAPARAAGLADLQSFLERGFTAFAAMRGASGFLAMVQERESSLITALFEGAGAVSVLSRAAMLDPPVGLP